MLSNHHTHTHPPLIHPTYTLTTPSHHTPHTPHTHTQAQNVFRVTHIIVPKQKGQSDSCETTHEEELFDAQDKYDLITLGWIHVSIIDDTEFRVHYHSVVCDLLYIMYTVGTLGLLTLRLRDVPTLVRGC